MYITDTGVLLTVWHTIGLLVFCHSDTDAATNVPLLKNRNLFRYGNNSTIVATA